MIELLKAALHEIEAMPSAEESLALAKEDEAPAADAAVAGSR
ncbi:hypothetical protein [Paraburkholderia domus]|nr:hypothetical protein [Paraburkholderia domus]CAE6881343.1 hypothetical protein R69749_07054 [Paraburkholderia domus]